MIKALKIAGIVVGVAACAAIITDVVITAVAAKKIADSLEDVPSLPDTDDDDNTFCENSDCKECEFKEYCK